MKKKLVFAIAAVLLGAMLGRIFQVKAQMNQMAELDQIENATILIAMKLPPMETKTGYVEYSTSGMGSLISVGEQTFLITHNHWGEILQDLTTVELRDAQYQLILPLHGYEFKNLILYQDAGTLVLRAPDELKNISVPATPGGALQVEPGETVQVAYRPDPLRDHVAILDAEVEAIITYEGLPAFQLRSQNGQTLQPGDSGGGVWHDGELVGNTWGVVMQPTGNSISATSNAVPGNLVESDISYAATLPTGHLLSGPSD